MNSTEGIRLPTNSDDNTTPSVDQVLSVGEPPLELANHSQEGRMSANYRSEDMELEDLQAFEHRLLELAAATRPSPLRWRLVLGTILACTAISACHWVEDLRESESIVLKSLSSRGAFAISVVTIVVMILYGVRHATKRQQSGTVGLTREILALFKIECDSDGHFAEGLRIQGDLQDKTPSRTSRFSRTSRVSRSSR